MRSIVAFLFLLIVAYGNNIENLLQKIEQRSDLSQRTQKENWGITYVFTRQDLQRAQARYLKDILITLLPLQYQLNTYGFYDPIAGNPRLPYMSIPIKLFIDNQEISVGMYGSGLILYGDMDLSFADHVEVYMGSPSFEISTEPSLMVIKIYTKSAERDGGNKIGLFAQSVGGAMGYAHRAEELESGWSYFGYVSSFVERYKPYYRYGARISRDKRASHFIGTFQKEDAHLLLDVVHKDMDSFLDQSIFATPEDGKIDVDYAHIGYDEKKEPIFCKTRL